MKTEILTQDGRDCIIYAGKAVDCILIQPEFEYDPDTAARELKIINSEAKENALFVLFTVSDWNKDLSPWPAPPVFKNEAFGDGAEETLRFLTESLLPLLRDRYKLSPEIPVILGGYSLAGLFSLWAAYRTDIFSAAAAVSPSVWFPGWMEYAQDHQPRTGKIYLSLGIKEERTKNKTMAAVGDCIREQQKLCDAHGIKNILEWNEGNHFTDPELRMAKGFVWCLKHEE